MYSLPPDVQEKAKLELNEEPEEIASKIEEFRKSIEESSNSDTPPLIQLDDDAFLLRFLRAKKYRQGDALKQYLNYCKYRITYPEIFDGLCFEKVRYLFETGAIGIFDAKTVGGHPVVIFFPRRIDISQQSILNDVCGAYLLLMEKLIEQPETQVNGVMAIENWEGVGFMELVKYQVVAHRESSKLLQLLQEAFPARFKGFWTVKEPWFMDLLYAVIKPFLSQKIKDRVRFLGEDFSQLYELIPKDQLPEEFGGTAPPFTGEAAIKLFEEDTPID